MSIGVLYRKLNYCLSVTILFLCFLDPIVAQVELERRAYFGFIPFVAEANMLTNQGYAENEGVLVTHLDLNGTFADLGVLEGDVLLQFDGKVIKDIDELRTIGGLIRAGEEIEIIISREGRELEFSGKTIGMPKEMTTHGEVLYDQFEFEDGIVRSIVHKPVTNEKRPAIFFIPGYTCSSIDNLISIHPYSQLLDSLSALGYVIYKAEKPGLGDNWNTGNCSDLGFHNELNSYSAAYDQLAGYSFVDPDNIFIWGHSLGGVYAPILAAEKQPKGVVFYGAIHDSWPEYLLRMVRFQNPILGVTDHLQTELDVRTLYALLYEQFYLKKSLAELAQNPEYKRLMERDFQYDGAGHIFSRSEDFWQELYSYNLAEFWLKFEGYVLSMNGTADLEVINGHAQREIVNMVNTYHPEHATFISINETDHSMIKVGSMEEGAKLRFEAQYGQLVAEQFNFNIVTYTHQFIKQFKD